MPGPQKDEEEEVHKNEKRLYGHFRNITPHEIRQVMHLPIDEAAEELGVSSTLLKKNCRKLGLMRWPSRAINSYRKQMIALEELVEKAKMHADNMMVIQCQQQFQRVAQDLEFIVHNLRYRRPMKFYVPTSRMKFIDCSDSVVPDNDPEPNDKLYLLATVALRFSSEGIK